MAPGNTLNPPAGLTSTAVVLILVLAFAGVVSSTSGGDSGCGSLCDEAAVSKLSVLYAYGIDNISAGRLDAGTAILQQVFTPDASIGTCFAPGVCLNKTGPVEWAQTASGLFSAGHYTATHHQMGNQLIQLDTNKQAGTMSHYVTATHFTSGTSNIDLYHGVYYEQVVKLPGGEWRISNLDLHTTSFLRFSGAPVSS